MIRFTCALALSLSLLAMAAAEEVKAPDLKGTWIPTEGMAAGQKFPDNFLTTTKLMLSDGRYTVVVGEEKEDGTCKMDFSKKPATCDIVAESGANKGKSIPAIIEVSGDTMKVCYNMNGADRPKDFTSTAENKFVMMSYKREKSK